VALDALLTEKNITRAGQQIHLSQSATSGALARLREFFGDELLVQIGRNMVLTPLAETLVKPVRNILVQVQATIEQRPEFDPAQSRRSFSFVMSDYTAMTLMPAVMRRASVQAPGISFEVVAPDNEPLARLDQGDTDFLLMPSNFLSPQHPSCWVFDEDFVCVCCRDNPLVGERISREQYLELGHVMVRFGDQRRPSLDIWLLERHGIERRAEVTIDNFATVPQYVLGTHRIATVHRRLADFWATRLAIRILPPPIDIPPVGWSLQWHQYRDIDPATRWVRELIVDTAQTI
jgi:LysR family nod box-dependent transcriptional activator